jgi:hypothetical protein
MAVFLLKTGGLGVYAAVMRQSLHRRAVPVDLRGLDRGTKNRGITGGSGGNHFCPASPNTRGQMAVFLTKTFGLVLYGP